MNKRVEMTGTTIDEAVDAALKELNVSKEEVNVIIVREPSKGFLGIGTKDAQVIVSIKGEDEEMSPNADSETDDFASTSLEIQNKNYVTESQTDTELDSEANADLDADDRVDSNDDVIADDEVSADGEESSSNYDNDDESFTKETEKVAVSFLTDVFEKMHFDIGLEVDYEAGSESEVYIRLNGAEVGITIGRRGETLDALQYLTNLAVTRKLGMGIKVILDVENYREKRRDTLVSLAERLEKKVYRSRRAITLEPMNAYERRIIHATLQNSRQVETYSVGSEPNRMVVIDLKGRRRD